MAVYDLMAKMFPSKNMVDWYMTEINRRPRPENDLLQSNAFGLAAQSPFDSTINRSSSSTDSTSPETFPELSAFRPEYNLRPTLEPSRPAYESPPQTYEPRTMYDTPKSSETQFLMRRQRPIVGRKILSETSTPTYERVQVTPAKTPEEFEIPPSIWQDDPVPMQLTPPNVNHFFIKNKNYTHHVLYELFPAENKGYEFKTPVKTSPTQSTMSNVSPMSNLSPSSMSVSPPPFPVSNLYPRSPNFPGSSRPHDGMNSQKMCTFCRKNGETPLVYMTHTVKARVGNKFVVSCPILRSHVCSTCGASGDNAHTITYCPVLRSSNNGQPLQSTTVTLKNTRVKSNGRRRY